MSDSEYNESYDEEQNEDDISDFVEDEDLLSNDDSEEKDSKIKKRNLNRLETHIV